MAIICGTVYLTSVKDTNLSISDTKVTKGDKLTIALVDEDGNPLVNKNITINVTDSKNKTKYYNVTTNNKGKYKFKVKLSKGKYSFNVEYKGELLLRSSNITKKVTVKEKEKIINRVSSTYSSSQQYSNEDYYGPHYSHSNYVEWNIVHNQDGTYSYQDSNGEWHTAGY